MIDGPAPPQFVVRKRHLIAISLGNALEFYDFLTYSFFAVYIGRVFFPSDQPSTSLILSLAIFGVGFITRPLGGWVVGRMGDRLGRRSAMMTSFFLMGVAIIGLALTPSYAAIGISAPILVVIFRMIQGFALGGEVGPSTAFMFEAAPAHRRGAYVALQFASQQLANLAGGLVGVTLSAVLSPQDLEAYGWRIAMLLGALVIPIGMVLRSSLPETLHHAPAAEAHDPYGPPPRLRVRVVVVSMMLLASGTIGTYVITYMSTYAIADLGLPPGIAFGATMVTGTAGIVFSMAGGIFSDHVGRRTLMVFGGLLRVAIIIPAFLLITAYHSVPIFYSAVFILMVLHSATIVPSVIWLSESDQARKRSGSVGTIYAVTISVFGGTTQVIVASLIAWLSDPMAPAYYWCGAAVLGLAAATLTNETAPRVPARRRSGVAT